MKMKTDKFDCAKRMPRLRHSIPNEPFDIRHSEIALWLCSQPSIMQYVFDMVAQPSRLGLIEYDNATKTWQGIDRMKSERGAK